MSYPHPTVACSEICGTKVGPSYKKRRLSQEQHQEETDDDEAPNIDEIAAEVDEDEDEVPVVDDEAMVEAMVEDINLTANEADLNLANLIENAEHLDQRMESVPPATNDQFSENLIADEGEVEKIKCLARNRNLGQKSKCGPQIEISVKNRNFAQESKFRSKIRILVQAKAIQRDPYIRTGQNRTGDKF